MAILGNHISGDEKLSELAIQTWVPMIKKPNPVYMFKMESDFTVQTNEGVLGAHAGDYVAHDPISGHFWPVAQSYVGQHYNLLEP